MSDRPTRRQRTAVAEPDPVVVAPPRVGRYNSLVAAAAVMTKQRLPGAVKRGGTPKVEKWQTELWRHYDETGEFRSGVTWASNGMSRMRLVPARPSETGGGDPTPISLDDKGITDAERAAFDLMSQFAGGPIGQGAMLGAFGQHLTVAGIGWLVAEPNRDDERAEEYESWQVLASANVRKKMVGSVERWELRDDSDEWRMAHPNVLVVKVWMRHPARPWEPDTPARSALIILDQIETLTLSITAVGQSRLAGAGILAIPSEATFPPSQRAVVEAEEVDPDAPEPDPADLFVETLIDTMITPIRDRGSAAAVVPLVIQVPGEHLQKLVHLTFEMSGVEDVVAKLEFAIRRLALSLDMPPEALTGMGDLTHWNAWQVSDQSITMHFAPKAEAICEGITDGFLAPALALLGHDPAAAVVWYDAVDLAVRPDRSGVVTEAYDRIEASRAAYMREIGLEGNDAPDDDERRERVLLRAMELAPQLVPDILKALGYIDDDLAATLTDAVTPDPPVVVAPAPGEAPQDGQEPPTEQDPTPTGGAPGSGPEAALAAALLEASDGIVHRALERAGSRLRSAAGRRVPGGASSIECEDPTRLHLTIDPTTHADLDYLLDGAWDRVPVVAARLGVDASSLTAALTAYTRALLAAQHEHTMGRLANTLGMHPVAVG